MTPPSKLGLFERFCNRLLLEDGSQMELFPEQRTMLGDYFEGATETLILIPKKNGKSTLLGALGLFHLTTTPDAACYIGASSRAQAGILYGQAKGFVERDEKSPRRYLSKYVEVKDGYKEIRSVRDSGFVRVLAADAATADGVIPTLALVDELHRQKSSDLYGVFHDALDARNGQMITISTAGDNEDSPLGVLRREAVDRGVTKQERGYRYIRDEGFAMHEWGLDPSEDREDLDIVKLVNPAPWQTKARLGRRRRSPSMTPWRWARFASGVWGLGTEPAFEVEKWLALPSEKKSIEPERIVTLGFDGSRRRDATGLVATDVETGFQHVVGSWERPPHADDTWEIPEADVTQQVEYAMDRWEVWRLYADPPYWSDTVDAWAGRWGDQRVVRWWTNRNKAMALAIHAWVNAWKPEQLTHDGDELLAKHIGNATRKGTRMYEGDEELFLIQKDSRDSPRKIDVAMAAILSWQARLDGLKAGALAEGGYDAGGWR